MIWTPDADAALRQAHGTMTIAEVAKCLGTTAPAIRARVTRLGLAKKRLWNHAEEEALRSLYENAGRDGVLRLAAFAASMGRDEGNISRKAKNLGLETNPSRKLVDARKDRRKWKTKEEVSASISAHAKARIARDGHPRGMLGKHHGQEAAAKISASSTAR